MITVYVLIKKCRVGEITVVRWKEAPVSKTSSTDDTLDTGGHRVVAHTALACIASCVAR